MSLTKEQLMQPRWKVIADYPDSEFEIGDMIMNYMPEQWRVWRGIKNGSWTEQTVHNPDKYPHLFKKLAWWEDRTPDEMPEYVRKSYNEMEVVKVLRYHNTHKNIFFLNHDGQEEYENLQYWFPATESEYQSHTSATKS